MALKFHNSPFDVTHDKAMAAKMALKTDLCALISKELTLRSHSNTQAAELLGLAPSKVLDIQKANIQEFTVDVLIGILVRLGFGFDTQSDSDKNTAGPTFTIQVTKRG